MLPSEIYFNLRILQGSHCNHLDTGINLFWKQVSANVFKSEVKRVEDRRILFFLEGRSSNKHTVVCFLTFSLFVNWLDPVPIKLFMAENFKCDLIEMWGSGEEHAKSHRYGYVFACTEMLFQHCTAVIWFVAILSLTDLIYRTIKGSSEEPILHWFLEILLQRHGLGILHIK